MCLEVTDLTLNNLIPIIIWLWLVEDPSGHQQQLSYLVQTKSWSLTLIIFALMDCMGQKRITTRCVLISTFIPKRTMQFFRLKYQ